LLLPSDQKFFCNAVCPHCANILTVSLTLNRTNRLECRTCPYEHAITDPVFSRRVFERKEREDVFGGPGAWDNAQKSKAQCPNEGCIGEEAAFFQVQIRSADEPMTSFFKCMTCGHRWREN
jgi:DNA-directed RNA polymerase III subunit RPC11